MADGQGIKIVEQGGVLHLSGVLNEYTDLSSLLAMAEPLRLNIQMVSRFNSIGIRNLLKFLAIWGNKAFSFERCPSEFIDQINMIPALLGTKGHGEIKSLYVPYECVSCDHEEDVLGTLDEYRDGVGGGSWPVRACGKCGNNMTMLTDSFFVFLSRGNPL